MIANSISLVFNESCKEEDGGELRGGVPPGRLDARDLTIRSILHY